MPAEENLPKFTARNLANALWALAKMMIDPGEKFLNGLRDEASKKCDDFNAQNLANTLWAFGTLGAPSHCSCTSTAIFSACMGAASCGLLARFLMVPLSVSGAGGQSWVRLQ